MSGGVPYPVHRTVTMHKDSVGRIGFQFNNGKIVSIVKDSSAARNGLLIDHQLLEVYSDFHTIFRSISVPTLYHIINNPAGQWSKCNRHERSRHHGNHIEWQ